CISSKSPCISPNAGRDRFDLYCIHHHAVVCYRRFPESVRKAPNWRGSVRRSVLRDDIVTVGGSFVRIFLWPRNPVSRETEIARGRDSVRIPVTPKDV